MAFLVYVRNSEVSLRNISARNKISYSIVSTGGITVFDLRWYFLIPFITTLMEYFFGGKDLSGYCNGIAQAIVS